MNTSRPASSADSARKLTQPSVRRPETSSRLRPVAKIAARAASSSQTFMLRRSSAASPGRAAWSGGIIGPLYTRLAEVEATTGKPNTPAVRARATVLFSSAWRSIDWTAKARPACWSANTTAQSAGVIRLEGNSITRSGTG